MEINIEERVELARTNFASGYNCSQSVAMAYADLFEVDSDTLAMISASFGGGLGRLREVCGAVSGMAIIAGFLSPAHNPADRGAKAANYALVQSFAEEFRRENGTIICRELLGLVAQKSVGEAPKRRRSCGELVEMSARIVGEYIAYK